MKISFFKYQGTGNDFVIVDDRERIFPRENNKLVAHLCDRRFGVGADGFMLLQPSSDYDFEMIYYNADGFEGSMCGNGGRSIVQFAYDQKIISDEATFLAIDGVHYAKVSDVVELTMGEVETYNKNGDAFFMNTGSPHHVKFVDSLNSFDVFSNGKNIRSSKLYAPDGTNVNFVERLDDNSIYVRTFERGVEDETLSCGTGVTACAIASVLTGMKSPIRVKTLGGDLSVSFDKKSDIFTNVRLTGPAKFVFKGEIDA